MAHSVSARLLLCVSSRSSRVHHITHADALPSHSGPRCIQWWSPGSPLSLVFSLWPSVCLDLRCRRGSKRATGVRELWPTRLRGNQENGDEANQVLSGHKVYVNDGGGTLLEILRSTKCETASFFLALEYFNLSIHMIDRKIQDTMGR